MFNISNIMSEIEVYKSNWLQHVQNEDRQNIETGPGIQRRNHGRLKKSWREQLFLEGLGTGN
jgi:hypothetical protein